MLEQQDTTQNRLLTADRVYDLVRESQLTAPSFASAIERYHNNPSDVAWQHPGVDDIDPLEDISANDNSTRGGLPSRIDAKTTSRLAQRIHGSVYIKPTTVTTTLQKATATVAASTSTAATTRKPAPTPTKTNISPPKHERHRALLPCLPEFTLYRVTDPDFRLDDYRIAVLPEFLKSQHNLYLIALHALLTQIAVPFDSNGCSSGGCGGKCGVCDSGGTDGSCSAMAIGEEEVDASVKSLERDVAALERDVLALSAEETEKDSTSTSPSLVRKPPRIHLVAVAASEKVMRGDLRALDALTTSQAFERNVRAARMQREAWEAAEREKMLAAGGGGAGNGGNIGTVADSGVASNNAGSVVSGMTSAAAVEVEVEIEEKKSKKTLKKQAKMKKRLQQQQEQIERRKGTLQQKLQLQHQKEQAKLIQQHQIQRDEEQQKSLLLKVQQDQQQSLKNAPSDEATDSGNSIDGNRSSGVVTPEPETATAGLWASLEALMNSGDDNDDNDDDYENNFDKDGTFQRIAESAALGIDRNNSIIASIRNDAPNVPETSLGADEAFHLEDVSKVVERALCEFDSESDDSQDALEEVVHSNENRFNELEAKYMELFRANKRLVLEQVRLNSRLDVMHKERLQRQKLESLCRELQKQNRKMNDEINQLNEALEKQQSQSLFKPKRADPVLTSASSLDTPTASPLTTPYSISTLLGLNAVDNSAKAGAHGDKSAHGATTTNPTTLSTATDLQATTLSPSSSTSTSSASAAKATTKPSTPPSAHVLQDQLRSFIEQYDLREAHFAAMLRASEAEIRVLEAKLEHQRKETEKEGNTVRALAAQVDLFLSTERDLRNQLQTYVDKFRQVEETLNKSNELFATFRVEMETMTMKTRMLERENLVLKSAVAAEPTALEGSVVGVESGKYSVVNDDSKKLEKVIAEKTRLENLCRALQAERIQLRNQIPTTPKLQ